MLSLSWNADPSKNGFGSDTEWAQRSGALVFSLGFRLNGLLPFGAERQGLASLEDGIRTAHIGLAQMIQGTEIEISNLVLTLQRIQVTMDALEQTAALAQRSFDLTEQAYRAGFVDLFQVQNAEQSLRQARVQLREQQINYLNGLIDLEYDLGVPFGTLTSNGSTTSAGSLTSTGSLQ
jgi:outer membrane protein TolC